MSGPERFGIGASVPRYEDPRLLTGGGRYTDDIRPEGLLRACLVRSPHPHARIRSIDTVAAARAEGVVEVLTGDDLIADEIGMGICLRPVNNADGSPMYEPPRPLLKRQFVRCVGDPVALVLAETVDQAKSAAELVAVDYEPLPAIVALADVLHDGVAPIRPDCPTNRAFHHELGDAAAVEQAFAGAAHVVEMTLDISRIHAAPMEPRAALGSYDAATGSYTVYVGVQGPHRLRDALAKHVFKVPADKVRVISPDLGGGFGNRSALYNEIALVLWAARRTGRPVKWTGERSESFLADDHARANISRAAMALDADGRFLGLRVHNAVDMGAYISSMGTAPAVMNLGCLAGVYRTPAIHVAVDAYFTNTNPTGPFRGAGRPEAIYVLERMIDKAARQLGIDRIELRRRNMLSPAELPYKTPLGDTYDSGDFPTNMAKALGAIDHAGFAARRAASQARGRLRGFGLANAIEAAGRAALWEYAQLAVTPEARLRLAVGTHSHGQGHETIYRQLIAEFLDVDFDSVDLVQGDTALVEKGIGTFGSRSLTSGGGAAKVAIEQVVEQGKAVAGDLLEAAQADIAFERGAYSVAGTDRTVTFRAVMQRAAETGVALGADATYNADATTYPNGCHVCEVEIDPETGTVELLRYLVVDDFGTVVNPMLAAGQVHGGVVQGIGQVLMEQVVWDRGSGQLLTGSFMDYAMPRAAQMPNIEVLKNPVPTKKNNLGVKGAGEAGCVGALACLTNAIVDAMAEAGVTEFDMPATPERVWRALTRR